MKIRDLVSGIRTQDLVLPEFQREYVWSRDQARQLLISLVKGYPVGGVLFWRTDNPPELKNIKKLPEKLGTVEVILDGQQRLTTLYLFMENDIPPYYKQADIQNDPRELCYHLGTGEFQYYLKSHMHGDPLWHRVLDCLDPKSINVFQIAQEVTKETEGEPFHYAQKFNDNLTALRNIKEIDLPVQIVPTEATITEAIDIFDRVNSQGTKLTDAELALTHVTGKWPEARRKMKEKIAELALRHFHFDLNFMTRALTAIVTRRALYKLIHGRSKDEVIKGWERLNKLLDYLISILPFKAFIHSTSDLSTPNVLVPILLYLDLQKGSFPNEKAMSNAIYWLYSAQMWARYTSQTDQRLEHDLSIVTRVDSPWSTLCDQIIDQRGRIEVKAADLEGRWITHPLCQMAVVVAKAQGALDWFNGVPLGTSHGKKYQIHCHHIFPQDLLYKNGYDSDNHLHRKIVNEIANRAFLTAETNLKLSNTAPEKYLPQVDEKYPGALVKQFVPMNPQIWKIEQFTEFLAARRELIAKKINEFMESLVREPEIQIERSVNELRQLGESATLEFKSTLRWDLIRQGVNKELQFSVLKTIAAFLNSDGGKLLIGVEDDGSIYGLEQDFKTLKNPTPDAFQQHLINLIVENIGVEFTSYVKISFETAEDYIVCVVEVSPSGGPAYLKSQAGSQFFIRAGNTSRSLDPEETTAYVQVHWQ
jgi:hypothetical protein